MQRIDGNSDDFGNGSAISEALTRVGLDPSVAAPEAETRMGGPENATAGHVPQASRIVVTDPPGEPTTLTLYRDDDDRPLGCIVLGPADAVRIAHDLTGAALRRYGRAPTEETQ